MTQNFSTSLEFLAAVIRYAIAGATHSKMPQPPVPPNLVTDEHPFTQFAIEKKISLNEFTTLLLALAPHLNASFFDDILKEHFPEGSHFPAFGGVRGKQHRGILPTGETAQFVLAGNDLAARLEVQCLLSPDHWLATQQILRLEDAPDGEPRMSGRLLLDAEWLEQLLTGRVAAPRLGTHFPAERLETQLTWEDLVLPATTMQRIRELETWIKHHHTLVQDWDLGRLLKPGYRALFHGPPGTGKTLTATLLGQSTGRDVYRIDLSLVVSKFIGETEKNLSNLFDRAAGKDWILFFDEADALFGKRTEVRDAHDKYANQEVSYLLQRVEAFPGLVILATNFRENIDNAFSRRFQSIVQFPFPQSAERFLIWKKVIPVGMPLADDVDIKELADRFQISGSSIVNIIQYCCLQYIDRKEKKMDKALLIEGIRRELQKEGQPM